MTRKKNAEVLLQKKNTKTQKERREMSASPRRNFYERGRDENLNGNNNNNNNNYDDDDDDDRISARAAQKHLEITHEISKILDCDLDRETLAVCISLLQNGVDPESLALVVKELKREAKRLRESRERAIGRGGM